MRTNRYGQRISWLCIASYAATACHWYAAQQPEEGGANVVPEAGGEIDASDYDVDAIEPEASAPPVPIRCSASWPIGSLTRVPGLEDVQVAGFTLTAPNADGAETAYFGRRDGSSIRLEATTRSDPSAPFAAPTALVNLNSEFNNVSPLLRGQWLYFTRIQNVDPATAQIFRAELRSDGSFGGEAKVSEVGHSTPHLGRSPTEFLVRSWTGSRYQLAIATETFGSFNVEPFAGVAGCSDVASASCAAAQLGPEGELYFSRFDERPESTPYVALATASGYGLPVRLSVATSAAARVLHVTANGCMVYLLVGTSELRVGTRYDPAGPAPNPLADAGSEAG